MKHHSSAPKPVAAQGFASPARAASIPVTTFGTGRAIPLAVYVPVFDEDVMFKALVDSHSVRLYRFILKHVVNRSDAEEIAQQTFVEAIQAYRNFRGESQLPTWLDGIAMKLVRNYLTHAPHRQHMLTDESALDFVSESDINGYAVNDPERRCAQIQLFQQLDAALAELPAHMRELLMLVCIEALSYEEAAVMLTVSVGTVRSRIARARRALTEKLAARGVSL